MDRITYGDHPSQFAELTVPVGADPVPVVVVIHGGFWMQQYDLDLGRPLAADLVAHGVAAYNVEYRRLGGDGGWPTTGDDVLAALDALDDPRLDLGTVVALGHSAGGHLAVWAAARHDLVTGAVSQAGVLDLAAHPRSRQLLGPDPDYADASPVEQVPIGVPVVCVHGTADENVPIAQSEAFQAASGCELVRLEGVGHMDLVDVTTPAWKACRDAALRLAGR
ncbi:alpha/beta hydrolase family protein [Umezawaea tangerina]|uniref:Prolyl oligopeptidase family protein n=1 Tax=Umezawaea tangerina TaxID=84725 RepID=A0A2T0SRZ1_9PSEU|nr:prolyl oligopeptidase family serine peptidase [Umezawaea tangerina]PRY36143.1 prolyl oligopeptidase family protein [Umezawaea tangerina]